MVVVWVLTWFWHDVAMIVALVCMISHGLGMTLFGLKDLGMVFLCFRHGLAWWWLVLACKYMESQRHRSYRPSFVLLLHDNAIISTKGKSEYKGSSPQLEAVPCGGMHHCKLLRVRQGYRYYRDRDNDWAPTAGWEPCLNPRQAIACVQRVRCLLS